MKSLLSMFELFVVAGWDACAVAHVLADVGQVICELPTSMIAPFSSDSKIGGSNGSRTAACGLWRRRHGDEDADDGEERQCDEGRRLEPRCVAGLAPSRRRTSQHDRPRPPPTIVRRPPTVLGAGTSPVPGTASGAAVGPALRARSGGAP